MIGIHHSIPIVETQILVLKTHDGIGRRLFGAERNGLFGIVKT